MTALRSACAAAAVGIAALALAGCDAFSLHQNASAPVALVYAVSLYLPANGEGNYPNLNAPRNDAADLDARFAAKGWTVRFRIDAAATPAQLAFDATDLASRIIPGQRVLFYWSGHGGALPIAGVRTNCIAMQGAFLSSGSVDLTSPSLVTPARLQAALKPLLDAGANIIIILDSCNSGGFALPGSLATDVPDNYDTTGLHNGATVVSPDAMSQAFSAYFKAQPAAGSLGGPSVWVLAAAGAEEESWESGNVGNGIFTYTFLAASDPHAWFPDKLAGDANLDGALTLREAYAYARDSIELAWNKKHALPSSRDYQFKPHLSGNPLDIRLF